MIDLIRAEVRRLWSRRMLRGFAAGVLVLMFVVAVITFFHSSNDPNSGVAQARAEIARCEQSRLSIPQEKGGGSFQCPKVDDLRAGYDRRFNYARSARDIARNVAASLFIVALLIGASFVGAEWGTGSMTTLLTWEPRRGRLLLAKWIAAVAACAVFVLAALIFVTFVFYPVGAFRGTTSGINGRWWADVGFTWLRGAGLAGIGATLGVAFATFVRNTAGAAGFGFVYLAIADPLLSLAYNRRFEQWFFRRNIAQLLGMPVQSAASNGGGFDQNGFQLVHLSSVRPALLLTAYALIALGIAYSAFRTRDVT